jgi:hypothetical protein
MRTLRFGRKLQLPSTAAIKHGILLLMLQDELKAQASATKADEGLVAEVHEDGTSADVRNPH